MKYLTLKLGGYEVSSPSDLKPEFTNLSSIISAILNIVFFIAVFIAFYWLVWGAFQYIAAGGNKETLAKARGRMIWALVGLVIIMLAFAASKFFAEVLKPVGGLPF